MRALEFLAKACALLAGLLLTTVTLMTCASLIGRNTTGWTIIGDFELTGVAAGEADAHGEYPEGSVNRAVQDRLRAFAERWFVFHGQGKRSDT